MLRGRARFFTMFAAVALIAVSQTATTDIRAVYSGLLRPDEEVRAFQNIDRFFPVRTVRKGSSVSPLPKRPGTIGPIVIRSHGRSYDLYDYLSLNRVAGLLVLKNGEIAYEDYELGTSPDTRWVSWSMVKSISSTLVGAAVKDGYIASLDDPVAKYVHELAGSAYDGVSIRQLLQMSSGVTWNEAYTDPRSDRRQMLDLQIAQQPGSILKFLASRPRKAPPGTVWNYSTGETHLVGALLESAIKKPLAEYLSEKIWSKAGMEDDATWWLESPGGMEVAGSGLSARLRDYARFGLFALNGGRIAGEQIVPENWFAEAGAAQQIGGKPNNYGYMWWVFGSEASAIHRSAFQASGIFGQSIYINPRERVVIVVWSARPKPTGSGVIDDDDFFGAVVSALR